MSSRTLQHWVRRTTKYASPAAVLASPRRASPSLSSTLASGPSWTRQSGVAPLQIRSFHPTPRRRLYVSNEAVVATCLALAGCGVLLARFISKRLRVVVTRVGGPAPLATSLVPPFSWIGPRSEKTLRSVMAIVTAGFEMASNRPIRLRDQAYREASFQVPHEVARLSPGAPGGGRVQEMAPLSIAREWQEETTKGGGEGLKPPFNIEREARVFLHFPKGSDRATVAFLAINADFGPSPMREEARVVRKRSNKQQTRLMNAAKAVWKCQYAQWVRLRPDIVRRIEPDELPLIITFRGTVWGMLWDTRGKTFVDLGPGMMMTDFYNKDS